MTNTREETAELMEAVRRLDCTLLAEHLEEREAHFRRQDALTSEDNADEVAELARQVARVQRARLALKAVQCRALLAARPAAVPHASSPRAQAGSSHAS